MQKLKILIFITKYLCYASNSIFALKLSRELAELGCEVEVCNIMDEEDASESLNPYIGKKYDAVIDFNSSMPRAMAGSERFLDLIDAPFYNYIVDHPLYHHPVLQIPLHDFNVICIDAGHEAYIRKYYPHIRNVLTLPLAGTRAVSHPAYEKREPCILFMGTYYAPHKYKNMIRRKPEEKRREYMEMAELLISEPSLTPEQAFVKMGRELGRDKEGLSPEKFREELNQAYPAEIYARAVNRERLLTAFIKADLPMVVCGNKWEKYPCRNQENLRLLEGVDYGQSLELLASCQVLLNVLPGFRSSAHDRVFSSMVNGTLLVSDTNPYLEQEFENGKNCLLFEYGEEQKMAEYMGKLMEDIGKRKEIAENGMEYAAKHHTWQQRARALKDHLCCR